MITPTLVFHFFLDNLSVYIHHIAYFSRCWGGLQDDTRFETLHKGVSEILIFEISTFWLHQLWFCTYISRTRYWIDIILDVRMGVDEFYKTMPSLCDSVEGLPRNWFLKFPLLANIGQILTFFTLYLNNGLLDSYQFFRVQRVSIKLQNHVKNIAKIVQFLKGYKKNPHMGTCKNGQFHFEHPISCTGWVWLSHIWYDRVQYLITFKTMYDMWGWGWLGGTHQAKKWVSLQLFRILVQCDQIKGN